MTLNSVLHLYPLVLYKSVTTVTMQDFCQTLIVAYLINEFPEGSVLCLQAPLEICLSLLLSEITITCKYYIYIYIYMTKLWMLVQVTGW
jgi:hypothetical protein